MNTKTKRTKRIHPTDDSVIADVNSIIAAIARDDNTGFCLECGAEQGGIEPDADKAWCESCGKPAV